MIAEAEEYDEDMCGVCEDGGGEGADDDYLDGENDDYVYGVDDGRGRGGGDRDGATEDIVVTSTDGCAAQRHVRDWQGKRRRLVTVTQWDASARAAMVRELGEGVT